MDVNGSTLCASALRSQLGPLGTQELVFSSGLRTLDIRAMRPSADIYCPEGAAAIRWFFDASGARVLAATASGQLHLLDASEATDPNPDRSMCCGSTSVRVAMEAGAGR